MITLENIRDYLRIRMELDVRGQLYFEEFIISEFPNDKYLDCRIFPDDNSLFILSMVSLENEETMYRIHPVDLSKFNEMEVIKFGKN